MTAKLDWTQRALLEDIRSRVRVQAEAIELLGRQNRELVDRLSCSLRVFETSLAQNKILTNNILALTGHVRRISVEKSNLLQCLGHQKYTDYFNDQQRIQWTSKEKAQ